MSNSPWMLENVCQYIPFYGVASMYRKEFFSFMENKRRFAISAILLLLNIACSFVYYSLVNEQVNEEVKTVFRLAGSFAVIVPFFVIVKLISEKKMPKIVRYIGANTVIVLACHTYGISLLMIVSRNIGIVNLFLTEFPYISKTLICITVMIAMVMPIYVINRYIPFIIGKKNIDRPV
jgi:fucose 4-O-acetylase-like acetyltransferase